MVSTFLVLVSVFMGGSLTLMLGNEIYCKTHREVCESNENYRKENPGSGAFMGRVDFKETGVALKYSPNFIKTTKATKAVAVEVGTKTKKLVNKTAKAIVEATDVD